MRALTVAVALPLLLLLLLLLLLIFCMAAPGLDDSPQAARHGFNRFLNMPRRNGLPLGQKGGKQARAAKALARQLSLPPLQDGPDMFDWIQIRRTCGPSWAADVVLVQPGASFPGRVLWVVVVHKDPSTRQP